jgi:radical SAM superfamily enzyme YgiQ (UPF0313 family)
MRIQLIHPPAHVNHNALTALRPAPPLGLAYIASTLRDAGHDVSVLDCLIEAPDQLTPEGPFCRVGLLDEEILDRIDPEAPVLGLTNMWTYAWPGLRPFIHKLKARFPDKILVCGGEHFTGLAEHSMREAPIDYIVLGEGESIVVELMARLESGEPFDPAEVGGICFRRGDEIVMNPRAKRMRNVDDIPWPAWDLFDLESYNSHRFSSGTYFGKSVPILATRGCPYECTYCANPNMWGRNWYARDPVKVVDEIEHYHRTYGATDFPFQDLTASLRKDWTVSFAQEIINRKLDIRWQLAVGTRCELMDDEVCELLYKSGCVTLYFAPESGSEETRKLIKKKMKYDSLMNAVDATRRANITLGIFLVIGFPHDRVENLRDTVRMVRDLARRGVEDICVPLFFPIPATELYNYLVKTGRLVPGDDVFRAPMLTHSRWVADDRNFCENISSNKLAFYKYWIVANFYGTLYLTHPSRVWRFIRHVFFTEEETSKMETFFIDMKRRVLARWRRKKVSGYHQARPRVLHGQPEQSAAR